MLKKCFFCGSSNVVGKIYDLLLAFGINADGER